MLENSYVDTWDDFRFLSRRVVQDGQRHGGEKGRDDPEAR